MPIDLPIRKTFNLSAPAIFDEAIAVMAVACFAVAVAGLVSHTPPTYREGVSAAVYEAMLQSP